MSSKVGLVAFDEKRQSFEVPRREGENRPPYKFTITSGILPETTEFAKAALMGWKLEIEDQSNTPKKFEINIENVVYSSAQRTATAEISVYIADYSSSGDDAYHGYVNVLFFAVDEFSPN